MSTQELETRAQATLADAFYYGRRIRTFTLYDQLIGPAEARNRLGYVVGDRRHTIHIYQEQPSTVQ